ncbi:hypothetical protein PSAR109036_13240 [Psychrobacter arenosus]|uniref:hypothetical protein n=1 Tax=Psychrobacter arenosus TaxID=256326 RepID=UPI002234400B|nr:hypothetical protein [Psychrobacter arenosus]
MNTQNLNTPLSATLPPAQPWFNECQVDATDALCRSPNVVMQPERLGAMHQTRLSFVRRLLRKIDRESWQLTKHVWALSPEGFGHVIYRLTTPNAIYHLVVFCNEIADDERNDRVIAQKWDVTFCLVYGEVHEELLQQLQDNVPLQEAGRNSNMVMVLARANKSVRVFDHIVSSLAQGEQPDPEVLAQVGYILRTTAVYGNGKFGIYDFTPLKDDADFGQSFSVQMCAVYLLKQFSVDWVDYLAQQRGGDQAVSLHPQLKRYLGVGNATGLGMAPYLITHPCIVDQWLSTRERALATVLATPITPEPVHYLQKLLSRAVRHLDETVTINEPQQQRNAQAVIELTALMASFKDKKPAVNDSGITGANTDGNANQNAIALANADTWGAFLQAHNELSFEAQEVLIACLMELYPEQVDAFEDLMNTDENLELPKGKTIADLIEVLEQRYAWAIHTDFDSGDNAYWFWYRSEDKEEPRLGIRGQEPGVDKELPLDIARQVQRLYAALQDTDQSQTIVAFILKHPKYRAIARRVWTLGHRLMGDIQMNVLHKDALPMHLLRCKLSMFGATKFDPRSDRWVRVTLFQGAPLFDEIHSDEWLFPLLPTRADLNADTFNNADIPVASPLVPANLGAQS